MSKDTSDYTRAFHALAEGLLNQIEALLPNYYKVTLVARCDHPDAEGKGSVILSGDDLEKVVQAIKDVNATGKVHLSPNARYDA